MTNAFASDQQSFNRILRRNISLPLIAGLITSAAFVGLILYLLSVMSSVEHSERVIGSANEVSKLAVDMETGMRGFALTGTEATLEPYQVSKPRFEVEMKNLRVEVADNRTQLNRLDRIQALFDQWDQYAQDVIQTRRDNGDYQALLDRSAGRAQFMQMREEFESFIELEQRQRRERSEEARSVTYSTIAGFVLLSIVSSGILAFFGRRELVRLSSTYSTALQQYAEHAEALQAQAWLRSGQSQLTERGIGQLTLPMLGTSLLEFLSSYLGAQVGALYVREDDGTLRRVAAYGFNHEDEPFGRAFRDREGLVGQAAAERRLMHLNEIPADYLKVNSGLGSTVAAQALVVPIDNEGTVNGVVELGFMQAVHPRDVEFMKLVAANIGTSVEASRYRQRLQNALEETQQLNEELQVQQEELRSSNEELEEQSRVLEESQANLENQKAELEQTNEQLANQAIVLDQKNIALNQAQQQLEERANELQRASRYKSEFLANMSHELRTPLNSSLILAKLLSDNSQGNLSEEQVKFAQTIYSSGNDLLNLINDILDISKVEAGKLEMSPEHVSLRKLGDALKMTFAPLADQKKLGFEIRIADDTPVNILTDHQRTEQILKNLLSNAIKFTDAGQVVLSISREGDNHVRFDVQDTGIGIPADQQQLIFDAFQQADGTSSRRYGGTGLGLSISRDLATLLGGSIRVSSQPNRGSTFTLVLPTAWQDTPAPAPPPAPVQPAPQVP
ncbi:MAG TPA: CHASE3 domain-containing protein, partial [Oxalicibacterium sp.]|nr:CHASE3 domain-containing protein [Oxalicibacterium sp.]